MSEQKYSIYDFPELLYNSKLFTNRQRCILLCLFSFLNLKGGGVYTIDIISEKTGIKKNHIYEELAKFYYEKDGEKVPIIRKEEKKLILDVGRLREFINYKIQKSQFRTKSESPKIGLKKSQNGTKTSPKTGLKKSQNGTKSSPKMGLENQDIAQEPQSPEGGVNNIFRKDFLDKNSQNRVLDNTIIGTCDKSETDFEEKKERLKVLRQKVREELEFQEVTSLSLQQITEAALKVRKKFAEVYKEKNKNLPAIRSHEFSQLKKLIALSCPDEEALKEWLEALLPKVENFWRIRNDFTRKHGHTFYTFVHTIPEILEGKGRSLVGKGKNEMLEVKVW